MTRKKVCRKSAPSFFVQKKGASLIAARPFSLLCPKWSLSVHVNVQLREWEVDSGLWQFFVETRIVVVENAPIVRSRHPNPDGQVDAACAQRTKRDKRRTICCFGLITAGSLLCFIGIFIFFSLSSAFLMALTILLSVSNLSRGARSPDSFLRAPFALRDRLRESVSRCVCLRSESSVFLVLQCRSRRRMRC